jgi:hypothetical protein
MRKDTTALSATWKRYLDTVNTLILGRYIPYTAPEVIRLALEIHGHLRVEGILPNR